MSTKKEMSIQGQHIQTIYTKYLNNDLVVNRKYQRKLVWTIEEKRNFMDTIINEFPIPLILIAEVIAEGKKQLEVIDGMQRLDAIFSYIEQKYRLMDGYFDLSVMADTLSLKNRGIIKQKKPVLSKEKSIKIANYLLPISRAMSLDDKGIEETFKRINSTGKHLSRQELRQSGVLSEFSDLVRKISSETRGDISRDSLSLRNMSEISIANHRMGYYGIQVEDIFWCKHQIISPEFIRDSRDEELIAYIISNICLESKNNFTPSMLDTYYGFSSNPLAIEHENVKLIDTHIKRIGRDQIKKQFDIVFGFIDELFGKRNLIFSKVIFNLKNNKWFLSDNFRAYHVIFMCFYELMIKRSMKVKNEEGIIKSLTNIGEVFFSTEKITELYKTKSFYTTVKSICGNLEEYFEKSEMRDDSVNDWTREISNILMQSRAESSSVDYKIGIYNLRTGERNVGLIPKLLKTLSSMNNLGKHQWSYIILGIADKQEDAEEYCNVYNSDKIKFHHFNVVGVEKEAEYKSKGLDNYLRMIREEIRQSSISPPEYKNHIVENIISRQFYGKEIVVFRSNFDQPVWYDGKMYLRTLSDCEEIAKDEYSSIYRKFTKG